VILLHVGVLVVSATDWLRSDANPATTHQVSSLYLISSDVRSTIVGWRLPSDLDEVVVSIHANRTARLAGNIKLCLGHGFIRYGGCTATLGIYGKHSELISVAFKKSGDLLSPNIWSNIVDSWHPASSMVQVLLLNHISSDL